MHIINLHCAACICHTLSSCMGATRNLQRHPPDADSAAGNYHFIGNNTIDNIETTWQLQSQIQTEWTWMNSNELKNRMNSNMFKLNFPEVFCLCNSWRQLRWRSCPVRTATISWCGREHIPSPEWGARTGVAWVEVLLEVLPTLCAFH